MFFYNVNMLPSELFEESISLRVCGLSEKWPLLLKIILYIFTSYNSCVFWQVYDSHSLRSDSLMGEFKVCSL